MLARPLRVVRLALRPLVGDHLRAPIDPLALIIQKVVAGRATLPASGTFQMRMVATKDEFDQLVTASASQALFVDFTASWCGP